ncbi:general stress protein 26 [Bacteroides reticulotermitis]|uniref:Pyridoxamine 5'-phosphate oxidase-like domain-containing protein n=3 Tax=Bacteroides reticulotermitis TaxID=1133319 RepID=W4UV50_9BACE|nr:pyridoxamine 5'-phosphate oxidase family protein [Bacteroides reticulotermitis]MBB4045633.1 general stress protein 26 [Bacteroides reticulotermitis]GAE84389.1 hypothetical protein JCM10512_2731 [Bacteroides reticulotermitis JCM 10512]
MDSKKIFEKVMKESTQIALASLSTSDEVMKPNVRLMCFYYDFTTKKIYFCTFQNSPKMAEFEKNERVAFTTCPIEEHLAVRVEDAIIQRSSKSAMEVLEEISKKISMFDDIKSGDISNIIPYEISFDKIHLHAEHNYVVDLENS